MKKILLSCILLAGPAHAAGASARAGKLGFGLEGGEQNGGTTKYWIDDFTAVDAGLGWSVSDDVSFHAGFQFHEWRLLPKLSQGELGLYVSPGFRVRGDEFGIRTVGGADYWLEGRPLEAFVEAGPIFRVTQGGHVDYTAVAGIRWYFQIERARASK